MKSFIIEKIIIICLQLGILAYEDVEKWSLYCIEFDIYDNDIIFEIPFLNSDNIIDIRNDLYEVVGSIELSEVIPYVLAVLRVKIISNKMSVEDTMDLLYKFAIEEHLNKIAPDVYYKIIDITIEFDIAELLKSPEKKESAKMNLLDWLDKYTEIYESIGYKF